MGIVKLAKFSCYNHRRLNNNLIVNDIETLPSLGQIKSLADAHQYQLEFIPLFEERYDLALPRENEEFIFHCSIIYRPRLFATNSIR